MDTTDALDRQLTAEVIRALHEAGMSQLALADRAGIPYTTLQRRLRSSGPGFTVIELLRVTDVLGISLTELALRAERALPARAA